jgi:hypothetical protein
LVPRRFGTNVVPANIDVEIVRIRGGTENLSINGQACTNRGAPDNERDHLLLFGVEPRCDRLLLLSGRIWGQVREGELKVFRRVSMMTEGGLNGREVPGDLRRLRDIPRITKVAQSFVCVARSEGRFRLRNVCCGAPIVLSGR